MSDSDADSDDWATEDLPPLPVRSTGINDDVVAATNDDDDDESEWQTKLPEPAVLVAAGDEQDVAQKEGSPMIIMDMTKFSKGTIHSKFDPNAVNDPIAVKALRKQVESDYCKYAEDALLIADRTVIPCGSTVWRPALVNLRVEQKGHYFCPIFPPK